MPYLTTCEMLYYGSTAVVSARPSSGDAAQRVRWQTSWTSKGLTSPSVLCRNRTLRRLRMNTMAFDKLATTAVPAAYASSAVQQGCVAELDNFFAGFMPQYHPSLSAQVTDGQHK